MTKTKTFFNRKPSKGLLTDIKDILTDAARLEDEGKEWASMNLRNMADRADYFARIDRLQAFLGILAMFAGLPAPEFRHNIELPKL